MSKISYLNGKYVPHEDALIHVEDRGNVFSDGIYEVMLVRDHVILNFNDHIARLKRSLDGLQIQYVVDAEFIHQIITRLLNENGLSEGVIYLQITRGIAPRNHLFPASDVQPTIWMIVSQPVFPSVIEYENGVSAITYPDLRWKRRDLKTISLLANILAREEARKQQATEAILYEENNIVTEGSSTNIFIVDQDDCIWTHPSSHLILSGVTRQNLLKLARIEGICLKEEGFSLTQLQQAKEVFMTSTTKHILPITVIDHKPVADQKIGDVTKQLTKLYRHFITSQISG